MKLLTDEREDIDAFTRDFRHACRRLARVLSRRGDSAEEVAAQLIEATRDAMDCYQLGGVHPADTWDMVELFHAMDWLMIIMARWLDSQGWEPFHATEMLSDHAAEMFLGIAQRVADEVARPRYGASEAAR